MSRSLTMRSLRDFARDGGATVIIAVVIATGTSLNGMYTSVSNGFN